MQTTTIAAARTATSALLLHAAARVAAAAVPKRSVRCNDEFGRHTGRPWLTDNADELLIAASRGDVAFQVAC